MLRKKSACLIQGATSHSGRAGALVLLSVSLAACSADVGRFDFASVGSPTESGRSAPSPSEPLRRNAGIPVEPENTYQRPPTGVDRTPAGGTREPAVRMSGLPDPVSSEPQARAVPRAAMSGAAGGQQIPTAAATGARATAKPGEVIEVLQGDTLYGISKRYHVAISELMTLNQLQNPTIKPGQKLTLPGGAKRAVAQRPVAQQPVGKATTVAAAPAAVPVAPAKAPRVAPVPAAAPAPVAAPVAAVVPSAEWHGSYTVVQGDSLFAIARKHSVKAADLQSANNITDPNKVRPGIVLKVPGNGAEPAVPAVAEAAPAVVPVAPGASAPAAPSKAGKSGAKPTIINASEAKAAPETRVAALGSNAPTQTDAAATPAAKAEPVAAAPTIAGASGKFRWPVKGKVITGFGPRSDNTHNDGINISVPAGTDVLAAEGGTVAYAGSELKGYGNLILVRHEGNWVSAYAHNDQLLVKRGDKVKRGQSIAKAGNTGSVDQPQVHFELRQGSKPIDPVPYMEKN